MRWGLSQFESVFLLVATKHGLTNRDKQLSIVRVAPKSTEFPISNMVHVKIKISLSEKEMLYY